MANNNITPIEAIKQIKEDLATLAENILNGEYCEKCKNPCNSDTDCYKQQIKLYNKLDNLAMED